MFEKIKSWFGIKKSLYNRIGGHAAIDVAVDIFYAKVLADPCVSYYFEDVDIDLQRLKQKRFLSMVCGGPQKYTGKQMRIAHEHLLALGLNDEHFDHVVVHLKSSLEECGVAASDLESILQVAESFRSDVLCR